MRFTATIGLALVLLVPGAALGQATAGGDEAAVRRVVQQHDQTRTNGDWKGSANLFTERMAKRLGPTHSTARETPSSATAPATVCASA